MKMFIRRSVISMQPTPNRHARGFTLLETVVIVFIASLLLTITAPVWHAFVAAFGLNNAQTTVYQAMREAQENARRNHLGWQASFRTLNGLVQWATHPSNVLPANAQWNALDVSVLIDAETNLQMTNGIYRIRFDDRGNVNGQLGRLTLASKTGGRTKRCVIISTLIGSMRISQNRPTSQDGRFCW